jgi:hypothetical protein
MRTTIEIRDEHRAELLDLAARRGEKGFSSLVGEALDAFLAAKRAEANRRGAALALKGSLSDSEARKLAAAVARIRERWR